RARIQGRRVEELGAVEDLGLAERAAVVTEQDRGGQAGRGEWSGGVDPRGDAQAELLHQLLLLVGSDGLRIDAALAEELGERNRLSWTDGDPSVSAAQHLRRREKGLRVLLLLLAAQQLVLVAARLDDPLVRQADRGEPGIRLHAGEPGIHLQREHSELRRQQLARLDQPLHALFVDVDAVVDAVEDEVEQALENVDDERLVPRGDLAQVLARLALHALVRAAALARDLGERAPQQKVAQRL